MENCIRMRPEEIERNFLSQFASLSSECLGRAKPEKKCDIRTDYQRDRDRILHCNSFRRLKHKTQVFLAPEGDHYRTRLTHTLEVSQIARTISRALRLNEDLTEAIALGHDLGHTPFGHAGERALNRCNDAGFRHFEQSVRVVELLEKGGKGLNLTKEVVNGIACHTRGEEAFTLEGRIVRVADKIAYMNHDIDDAARAGVIAEGDIPKDISEVLGNSKSERITALINSAILGSDGKNEISLGGEAKDAFYKLNDFLFENVYFNPIAKSEESKAEDLVSRLFEYYVNHKDAFTGEYKAICEREGAQRAACDYIAGMTDRFAMHVYSDLFIPKSWQY